MDSAITFIELLEYTEVETARWKNWFAAHPQVLDVKCDVAKAGSVRGLLLHIFGTELFFAHAVLSLPEPDWKILSSKTVDELFAVGEDARKKIGKFIAKAKTRDWNEVKVLHDGAIIASKRKMVAQALLHGVHHRAQLATFLRQQRFRGMWVHDLILTDVMH